MEKIIEIVSKGMVRWPFMALYTLTSIFHVWFVCSTQSKGSAILSVLTALVDWVAILGFVTRRPLLSFQFWRWWFAWSLFWFFFTGYGRDMLSEFSIDPYFLLLFSISATYYFIFFTMVYAYAYVEKEIWRY